MAISAPVESAQFAQYNASPRQMVKPTDWGAVKRYSYGKLTFTAAGFTTAAAGDLKLIRMPAGRIRILERESWVVCPQGTATSQLDLGWGAYVGLDGVAVAADGDGIAASIAVGAGAINQSLDEIAAGGVQVGVLDGVLFESQSGWDLVASFDTADSPASGNLIVAVTYLIGR